MIVGITEEVEERERADRLFGALSNSTRRDIVRRTLGAEYSVSDLSRCYSTSFAAVQKHVAVLEQAGLVFKEARGREQIVRGDKDTIDSVHSLLDQLEAVWRERIERFDQTLKESDPEETR